MPPLFLATSGGTAAKQFPKPIGKAQLFRKSSGEAAIAGSNFQSPFQ
jgi:hypothetical protein